MLTNQMSASKKNWQNRYEDLFDSPAQLVAYTFVNNIAETCRA